MSNLIFTDVADGRFYNADCFAAMREIPDGVVDMVLCDLPYGTTSCSWDFILPMDELWAEFHRLTKKQSPVVLTASEPFTSVLITSNLRQFKHRWTWDKVKPASGLNAKNAPLRVAEDIVVFCSGKVPYYPQMIDKKQRSEMKFDSNGEAFGGKKVERIHDNQGKGYPKDILTISNADQRDRIHPTQKPVALFEYLIKTYSEENALVLDITAGSGTTAVACKNLNRRWVCIEKDEGYYNKAVARLG